MVVLFAVGKVDRIIADNGWPQKAFRCYFEKTGPCCLKNRACNFGKTVSL